jgi:hypothetical protein
MKIQTLINILNKNFANFHFHIACSYRNPYSNTITVFETPIELKYDKNILPKFFQVVMDNKQNVIQSSKYNDFIQTLRKLEKI